MRRRYVAILSGVPSASKGRIEAPIGRDPRDRLSMARRPGGGRFAASNYEVIATLANGNASLVEWRLETGRTHQIRVHARHIGHPILGDDTYGGGVRRESRSSRGTAGSIRNAPRRCSPPSIVRCFTRARSASHIHARARSSTSAETHRTISKRSPLGSPPSTNGERSPRQSKVETSGRRGRASERLTRSSTLYYH